MPAILEERALSFFIVYNLSGADRADGHSTPARWLQAGALQHAIALRLPLEQIAQAHEAVESGRVIGNVVLGVADEASLA